MEHLEGHARVFFGTDGTPKTNWCRAVTLAVRRLEVKCAAQVLTYWVCDARCMVVSYKLTVAMLLTVHK